MMMMHTYFSHCSIFGMILFGMVLCLLCGYSFRLLFFLLPRNVAAQIKRMHGLSFCVQCAWVRSLSFFALQWINYMFNTSINICILSSFHMTLFFLSLWPQPIWSEFYSFYSFRPSFAIPQEYRNMVGFWLKYEKYTALQIHQTIAETNRTEHTHTQNEQIIIIERNGFK